MSKKDENKLVPKLRFREFESDVKWTEKLIEQYFNVGSSKRVLQEDWANHGVPFFRTRELVSLGKNEPFSSEVFISEELFSELKEQYGVPKEGDFLVSGVGTLGVCYQVQANDRFYFKDGNVLWFRLEGSLHSTYFKYCFQSDHIQNQIKGQASKSTVGTYTIQNAKKTKVWIPTSYQEQKKIASCLSSLDEVITAESQKLKVLKEHKKGLLQNLFPPPSTSSGGERVPKLRFKEFKGEWEEKTLGEVAVGGLSNGVFNDPKKVGYGYKLINVLDMYIDTTINENTLSLIGISETEFMKNKVEFGDIFFTRSSLVKAGIAQSNIYLGKSEDITYDGHLIKLRPDTSTVIPMFLHYVLKSEKVRSQLISKGKSATMTTIGQVDVASTTFSFPRIKEEQQKIAFCLSSLDEIIQTQAEKIELLKQHKKGLLQGLFPKMND